VILYLSLSIAFANMRPTSPSERPEMTQSRHAVQFQPTRRTLVAGAAALALLPTGTAWAAETVRLAMVQSWWPTTIAMAAQRLKLFEKEGIKAEITVYKGGAPSFEALAAGAADINVNGAYLVALGRGKGVMSRIVATAGTKYAGWHLVVKKDSPIRSAADLAGKKVGISANGSISDFLALWTIKNRNAKFTRVPLGAGGIVPSLASGNVDAIVIWSPVSYKILQDGTGRSIINFADEVQEDLNAGWIATDEMIAKRPQAVQGTLNALFGAAQYLQKNRQFAIDLIAEINEIPKDVATKEYEASILSASTDGVIVPQAAERSVELGKAGGLANLAPASDTYVQKFKPVPTRP
jgi:ABC-type nitrate/sulfonate/bicarbonate transport systems, periplasmic components